ncbi:MAG: hypothetical protein HWD59_03930 [Coxiellaceae bacterium]|nr:MAG: hypothetical protein HWD59_03930 [Coxiellaceae bacterium]
MEIRAFISEISAKYKASYSESEQKFYCDEETVNQFEAELEEIYEQIEEILNNVSLLNGFLKPENKCRIQITGLTLPPCEEKYKFIFDHHIISQCVFGVSLTKASFYSTQFNRVTLSQESTIKAETALGIGNNNNSNNNNQNFPVDIGGRIKFGFESGMPEFFEDDSRTKWLAVAIELAAIAAITPKTYGKLLSNAQSLKILCPVLENIALSKKRWERLNEENGVTA